MALRGSGARHLRILTQIIQFFSFVGFALSLKVVERPVNASAKIGETVILRCTVQGEDGELVAAHWVRDGMALGFDDRNLDGYPTYTIIGDVGKGEHHLQIKPVALTDDAVFECQVPPSGGQQQEFRASASVSVLVAPTNITLERHKQGAKTKVFDGSTVEVTCAVLGGKPAAEIMWFKNGERINDGVTISVHEHSDKTVDTRGKLKFVASSADHKAVLTCQALHPALPEGSSLRANFSLSVIYPPGVPVTQVFGGDDIITAGKRIKLECRVANGNPLPQVFWERSGKRLDSIYHHQPDVTINEYSFDVNYEDDGAEYKCVAKNQATVTPLFTSVTLKVYYAPSKVEITGRENAKAGDKVNLQCTTAPSRPAAKIQWIINGRPITTFTTAQKPVPNTSGKITVSNVTVELKEDQRSDVHVACSAMNEELQRRTGEDSRKTTKFLISVQYPPESITMYGHDGGPLRAGQQHLLTCVAEGGKPLAKIHWFKGKTKRQRKKIKWREIEEGISNSVTDRSAQSELRFKVSSRDNRAVYRCEARSAALNKPLRDSANLTVYFPPKDVNITVTSSSSNSYHLSAGDIGKLICASGSGNPMPVMSWWKDGLRQDSADIQRGKGEHFGFTIKNRLFVPLEPSSDGETYTCRAENKEIEMHVSKSITLSVHYEPQFTIENPQVITVLENESISVNVTATAKPNQISYSWRKLGSNIVVPTSSRSDGGLWASGPILKSSRIKRSDTSSYIVFAKNSEGTSNFTVNITVRYPANITRVTSPVVADIGEDITLECEANAYPKTPRMVHWERENFDMSKVILKFGDGKAELRIKSVQKDQSGIFYCVASNEIGKPARVEAHLLVRQAPELDNSPPYRKSAGKIGSSGVLRCRATGAPAVSISWFNRGGQLVKSNRRMRVSHRKVGPVIYESTVEIEPVENDDYGTYTCAATNELGRQRMEVEFEKVGPPSLPENLKVVNVSGTSVTLGWKPGFDGGMPQSFQLRYRVLGESQYHHVNVKPADTTRYTLTDLKPFTRYSFSVGARSRIGFSGYSEDGVIQETYGKDPEGISRGKVDDSSPLLMIILICLVGVILLVLNICLVCCCIKRHRRKKLQATSAARERSKHVTIHSPSLSEKAASARLMEAPRPVQMYGGEMASGLRPDSQYSEQDHKGGHSEFSEDDQSVRTIIEVDSAGQPVFRSDRISPGTYQTYLVDDPYAALMASDYADHVPSGATYAESLRNNSLQRRIAAGQYSPAGYPEMMGPQYPGDGPDDHIPPAMGPLRTLSEELNQYGPYQYSPARSNGLLRRYSPGSASAGSPPPATVCASATTPGAIPTVVQSTGATPYAEVRPMVSSLGHNGTNGSIPSNNGRLNGSPVLSTFSGYSNKPKQEYMNMEQLSGDLV